MHDGEYDPECQCHQVAITPRDIHLEIVYQVIAVSRGWVDPQHRHGTQDGTHGDEERDPSGAVG